MKKFFVIASFIIAFGTSSAAFAADWKSDIDAAVKYNNFNKIDVVAASHPESQGAIAVYLLQLAQAEHDPQREARIFKSATSFVGRVSVDQAGTARDRIDSIVKATSNPTFKKNHPREAGDIFLNALLMSKQPNIAANDPNLHSEVLQAADDFVKEHPQDVDKRLLEQVSLAQTGGSANSPRGVISPNPAVSSAALGSGGWKSDIDAAVKYNDFNKINIIAASHPESQGAIAVYLLQLSQQNSGNPQREVQIFKSATPFVGRVPASDAGKVGEIVTAMLKIAADPTFKKNHPREASDIFLSALLMSNQPNIVANDPNLHAEVLEAADDFIKEHPQDADKRLTEQVDLAEAGGAPETPPRGVINPSAE